MPCQHCKIVPPARHRRPVGLRLARSSPIEGAQVQGEAHESAPKQRPDDVARPRIQFNHPSQYAGARRRHTGRRPVRRKGGCAAGAADLGHSCVDGPDLVRSGRDIGSDHPVHGALRAAGRDAEADARQSVCALARRVVDGVGRRPQLRIPAAQGTDLPQRRADHGRGREVLVHALPRSLARSAGEPGGGDRDPRPPACALPPQGAVAGLPDVLRDGNRRRLDRAEEVRREGRRRRLSQGADRRRPLQVRFLQARRRAGARGLRRLLAQDAEREAPGVPRHSRRGDAPGGPDPRRGRHRLFDPRRAGGRAAQDTRAQPEARRSRRRRSGSTSPTSGTRNRHGTTSGCARPPAWRSTATVSTRR